MSLARSRAAVVAFLVVPSVSACPSPTPTPDAALLLDVPADGGAPALDAGPPDAGSRPEEVQFEPIEVDGTALDVNWGFLVAPIDVSRAIVFGGTDSTRDLAQAYRYDVSSGRVVVTPIESTGPRGRYCGCMAYDPTHNRVLMVGGRTLRGTIYNEAWWLDLATDTWTPRSFAGQPGGVGCSLAYATTRDAFYLFGGGSAAGFDHRTYRLDEEARRWVEIPGDGPSGRYDAVLMPSRDGRSLELFAGSYGANGTAFFADMWRFDVTAETWSEVAIAGDPPAGRRTPWVARHPSRDLYYWGFGYDGNMRPLGDLYLLDPAAGTYTAIELDSPPPARGFSTALPGGPGAFGVMSGGLGVDEPILASHVRLRSR